MRPKKVLVSGGFDPLHVGHTRLIEAAARFGKVIVALNSDDWLLRKKGYVFMPWGERAAILCAMADVHQVVPVDDSEGHVGLALIQVKPHYFANGGDRTAPNEWEHQACLTLGIEELFNVGGAKIQSSSALVLRRAS